MSCQLPNKNKIIYDYCLNLPEELHTRVYFPLMCDRVKCILRDIVEQSDNKKTWIYADDEFLKCIKTIINEFYSNELNYQLCDLPTIKVKIDDSHNNVVLFLVQSIFLPNASNNITHVYYSLFSGIVSDQSKKSRILRLFSPVNILEFDEGSEKSFLEFIAFKQKHKKNAVRSYAILMLYRDVQIIKCETSETVIKPLPSFQYSTFVHWYRDHNIPIQSQIIGPYHSGYFIWNILNEIHENLIVSYKGYAMNLNVATMNITQTPDNYLRHLFHNI